MERSTPLSFAPTSTTAYSASDRANINFHQEITKNQLYSTTLQKTVYDAFAEIYSIITVLEMLENAFVKDFVTDKEKYTSTCLRLINQYQILTRGIFEDGDKLEFAKQQLITSLTPLPIDVAGDFPQLFCDKFNISTSHAVTRLKTGVPLTIEHLSVQLSHGHSTGVSGIGAGTGSGSGGSTSARLVAEITGSFITIMDALKLNYKTKDQLHPLLSDLVVGLNDLVNIDNNDQTLEFHGKSKLVGWLIKLNNLGDSELGEEDIAQFLDDLDIAYKGFYTSLK